MTTDKHPPQFAYTLVHVIEWLVVIDKRFDRIDERFDALELKNTSIEGRLDDIEGVLYEIRDLLTARDAQGGNHE